MSATNFLRLPPAVSTLVVVMLWPAIWAGAGLIVAFTGDVLRQAKKRTSSAWRKVA
jgi:hypothetical protein